MGQGLNFDTTLGAAFCGFAASSMLYGVLYAQVYSYFQRYSLDRPVYKILVLSLLALESLHQGLVAYTVYYYSITNYGNPIALLFPVWTLLIQVTIGAFISVVVKSCFAMRVWRFSNHNRPLTIIIALMIAAQFALALAFTIESFGIKSFAEVSRLKVLTTITLANSVVTDMALAGSLTYFLHHLRSRNATPHSNTLVNGLIRYSVETGAATSVCGVCTLVLFDFMPNTFLYLAFYFVLSKLYSNSLLVTLNTRLAVRCRGTDRERGTATDFSIIHTMHGGTTATRIELKTLELPQGDMRLNEKRLPSVPSAVVHTSINTMTQSQSKHKPEYASEW